MSENPSLPPPPLSRQALGEVELIAEDTQDRLENCGANLERSRRILRTGVVESLNVQMDYYFALPNYQATWIVQLIPRTVDSLIGMINPFIPDEELRKDLLQTAVHHLGQWLEAKKNKAATGASLKPDGNDRGTLKKAYLAKFPEVLILDICWAAGQHYSEWKRWLRNAVEDGSAPDHAFRAILISEKMPGEYRNQPRPKGWK
jgi:hypothetical protein